MDALKRNAAALHSLEIAVSQARRDIELAERGEAVEGLRLYGIARKRYVAIKHSLIAAFVDKQCELLGVN